MEYRKNLDFTLKKHERVMQTIREKIKEMKKNNLKTLLDYRKAYFSCKIFLNELRTNRVSKLSSLPLVTEFYHRANSRQEVNTQIIFDIVNRNLPKDLAKCELCLIENPEIPMDCGCIFCWKCLKTKSRDQTKTCPNCMKKVISFEEEKKTLRVDESVNVRDFSYENIQVPIKKEYCALCHNPGTTIEFECGHQICINCIELSLKNPLKRCLKCPQSITTEVKVKILSIITRCPRCKKNRCFDNMMFLDCDCMLCIYCLEEFHDICPFLPKSTFNPKSYQAEYPKPPIQDHILKTDDIIFCWNCNGDTNLACKCSCWNCSLLADTTHEQYCSRCRGSFTYDFIKYKQNYMKLCDRCNDKKLHINLMVFPCGCEVCTKCLQKFKRIELDRCRFRRNCRKNYSVNDRKVINSALERIFPKGNAGNSCHICGSLYRLLCKCTCVNCGSKTPGVCQKCRVNKVIPNLSTYIL